MGTASCLWMLTNPCVCRVPHSTLRQVHGCFKAGCLTTAASAALSLQVDEQGNIVDSCFKTFGCGSAIASSSVATEW